MRLTLIGSDRQRQKEGCSGTWKRAPLGRARAGSLLRLKVSRMESEKSGRRARLRAGVSWLLVASPKVFPEQQGSSGNPGKDLVLSSFIRYWDFL